MKNKFFIHNFANKFTFFLENLQNTFEWESFSFIMKFDISLCVPGILLSVVTSKIKN